MKKEFLYRDLLIIFAILFFFLIIIFSGAVIFEKKLKQEISKIYVNNALYMVPKIIRILDANTSFSFKNNRLNLFIDRNLRYLYVIKKDNNGMYYIADGSEKNERSFYKQPFFPLNNDLWNKVYKYKHFVYNSNSKVDGVWFTFLYPVLDKNHKIKYVISMDFSVETLTQFTKIFSIFKYTIVFVLIVIFISFSVVLFYIYRLNKEKMLRFTDKLTQVYNREILSLINVKELEGSVLAMFDLDHFKKINDTYGHLVGDKVLKRFAEIVKSHIRKYDLFVRYGGEEFVLILRDISERDAIKKIHEILEDVRHTPINIDYNKSINITVSCGINLHPERAKDIFEAINIADKALYKAKKQGRDRLVVYK